MHWCTLGLTMVYFCSQLVFRSYSIFKTFLDLLESSSQNYASRRPTAQINTEEEYGPRLAVDEDIKTYTRTRTTQDPWWRVELEYSIFVFQVVIYNRHTECCKDRLHNFEIIINNQLEGVTKNASKCGGLHSLKNKDSGTFYCKPAIYGKYVIVQMYRNDVLNIGEVEVYGKT